MFFEASNLYHKKLFKTNEMSFVILEISLEADFKNLGIIYDYNIIHFSTK